jgi:hypothetical protein
MGAQFDSDDPVFRVALADNLISLLDNYDAPLDKPEKFHKSLADVFTPKAVVPAKYITLVDLGILRQSGPLKVSSTPATRPGIHLLR